MQKYSFAKSIFLIFIITATFGIATCLNGSTAAPADANIADVEATIKDTVVTPEATRVIALLLDPHIRAAIDNYFGEPTQYASYNATINEITQVGNDFAYKVIISVQTFHGAHNPPYGMETMTFTIRSGGRVVLDNYVHQNI